MIIIGDISSNWDGNIENAKRLIYELKECGGSIAKFQYWNTEKLINKKAFGNIGKIGHQAKWDKGVFETYKKYELPLDYIPILADYAKSVDIGFAVTCYDLDKIDEIDKYNCISKIGSGEITHAEMLVKTAQKNKLVLLGTGASNINEVIFATNIIQQFNRQIVLMQCNTSYIDDQDKINYACINVLKSYKIYFPAYDIGLSDHSKNIYPVILAQSLGANFIERHFIGSLKNDSPDSAFSMTSMEMKYLVKELNTCAHVLGNTFKEVCSNEIESRTVQRRALYATKDLKIGHTITKDDVIALRPAPEGYLTPLFNLEGMKLKKDVKKDDPFLLSNVELKDKK